ncbi:MAG TPA: chemotaxis protein CheB [Thermoanaerobaculia bacterium]|nr:chemotaxis protein CheB [Thermoanaerobaculia bacterium]
MAIPRVVVIGGSAGSIEPLRRIVDHLPADFPCAILVTIHTSPSSPGHLVELLATTTGIPVSYAADGQRIQPGHVLVAPPDRHLIARDGTVSLSRGPRENRARPAIDPMFRSAAAAYRERVIGVILSGLLDDGADGLMAIRNAGGRAIVQDPNEAAYPDMPQEALRVAAVEEVLTAAAIGDRLARLAHESAEESRGSGAGKEAVSDGDELGRGGFETSGTPSGFACPECHGALWQLREGRLVRFRCRTGHAFSADSAAAALDEDVERALWTALRSVEEKAALARKLMASAEERNSPLTVAMYEKRLREAQASARTLRRLLGAEKARLVSPTKRLRATAPAKAGRGTARRPPPAARRPPPAAQAS